MAESYPTFSGSQRVGARLMASLLSQTVRKVLDTSRTSEVVALDPELQFTVEANAVYRMEGILYVSSNSAVGVAPDDDIVIDFEVPSSATGKWGAVGLQTNSAEDSAFGGLARLIGSDVDQGRQYGTDSGGIVDPSTIHFQGILITSSGGTYGLSWSRGPTATTAETITVYADSLMTIQRVA